MGRTIPRGGTVVIPDDEAEVGVIAGINDPETLAQATAAAAAGAPAKPKMYRIILEETDNMGPTGQPFGINGKAYMIRPNEEVTVPEGIIDILDNAVMSVPIIDGQTLKVIGYRDRLRFPYRFVRSSLAA